MRIWGLSAGIVLFAGAASGQSNEDLARQLSNPVADLISLPLQLNYDQNIGPDDAIDRWTLNIQPVVPLSLNSEWNVISRTIVPYIWLDGPGGRDQGFGDVVQSFFFSPKEPTAGGWIWGAGPVLLIPLGEDEFSADTWGLGPTAVALRQQGPWTYGGLANHIWSVGGDSDSELDPSSEINATFLQPFLTYTTPGAITFSFNTEATYDWAAEEWTVPVFAGVSKVLQIGEQPVSLAGGVRYYVDSPPGGAEGWAARAVLTFLFPR